LASGVFSAVHDFRETFRSADRQRSFVAGAQDALLVLTLEVLGDADGLIDDEVALARGILGKTKDFVEAALVMLPDPSDDAVLWHDARSFLQVKSGEAFAPKTHFIRSFNPEPKAT
jgi:hypothetical protein